MSYRLPANSAHIDGADKEQGAGLQLTLLPHGQAVCLDSTGRPLPVSPTEGSDVVADIAEEFG